MVDGVVDAVIERVQFKIGSPDTPPPILPIAKALNVDST